MYEITQFPSDEFQSLNFYFWKLIYQMALGNGFRVSIHIYFSFLNFEFSENGKSMERYIYVYFERR